MQLRHGAVCTECTSGCEGSMQQHGACLYHRQSADGKHYAHWHVYLHGEPAGSGSDCGSAGSAYTDALHTGDVSTLGAGQPDRIGRWETSSE